MMWPKIRRTLELVFTVVLLTVLLASDIIVSSFHAGTALPPTSVQKSEGRARGEWIGKEKYGVNLLVLEGSAFDRGKKSGQLTKNLLFKQEEELVRQATRFMPNRLALQAVIVFASRYFRGLDKYFEPWALQEIYGVSLSAPPEFNDLANGYTRQIGYHGLHEAGQMVVDQKDGAMGCTVVAFPYQKSWIVGRNFDFEGGRIFDEEKIVKWEFPEPNEGNAYVSVIWAGMVGGVTGVNENGIYISINAAGSDDYRRVGTPSTIVLTKVLQFSKSMAEALEILKNETMFITDIFFVTDSKSGRSFTVEKSPQKTSVTELHKPTIVTNHLTSEVFRGDKTNAMRERELTTMARFNRGSEMLDLLKPEKSNSPNEAVDKTLAVLRDKNAVGGNALHLGNRGAIDAMIATHSVIYNGIDQILYVSQGPGLSGAYTGFDLKRSFAEKNPVVTAGLRQDSDVSPFKFRQVHEAADHVLTARKAAAKKDCLTAESELEKAKSLYADSSDYFATRGDWLSCLGRIDEAKTEWMKALEANPPYRADKEKLLEKIGNSTHRVADD